MVKRIHFRDLLWFVRAVTVLSLLSTNASAGLASVIFTPFRDVLCAILFALLDVAAALGALVFIYAGVQWGISRDDPGKRKAALTMMTHVILGLLAVGVTRNIIVPMTPFGGIWCKGAPTPPGISMPWN